MKTFIILVFAVLFTSCKDNPMMPERNIIPLYSRWELNPDRESITLWVASGLKDDSPKFSYLSASISYLTYSPDSLIFNDSLPAYRIRIRSTEIDTVRAYGIRD